MADPQKDEHIEELLSKLQGIFGKLSNAEEEESKQKVDVPLKPPVEEKAAPVRPAAPPPEPVRPSTPPPAAEPAPAPVFQEPPSPTPDPLTAPEPASVSTPPAPTPVSSGAANAGGYESISPVSDPEKLIIPTAVFYPTGKEVEAKSLSLKLEMMTPKFTKVAFRLRVIVFAPYDPKTEWKDTAMKMTIENGCQTSFVVVDRPLDDLRKKTLTSECEEKNIYFQDVTLGSIEKKAYYTDILLGLVFFFDSHRPPTQGQA